MRNFICAALLTCSGPAFATTLLAMDVPSLSRSADAVVQGTVTRQTPRWTKDCARIVTDVEIAVSDTLKGATGPTVVLLQLGGEVDDVGQRVEGVGTFATGDEVVVFLQKVGTERFQLVGMAQGKFKVERSSDGRAAFVTPDHGGDALLLDATTRQPLSQVSQVLTLDALKTQIRTALAGSLGSARDRQGTVAPAVSPVLKGTK